MRGATFIARADAFASAAESLFEEVIWVEDGDDSAGPAGRASAGDPDRPVKLGRR